MTSPPADAAVREAALDPSRSFIVDAPAGSGKTTLLTQRFLRLLSMTTQPESIVAITFTRKAAEEMRGRILDALCGVTDYPERLDPVTLRWASEARAASEARGWRLLENPRRLRVQTIDSLCATLARHGPLMSGYASSAEVREDATAFYTRAAHASIEVLGTRGVWSDAVRTLLRHLDNDWARLEGLLVDMLARRDQWLRVIAEQPDRIRFERAIAQAVRAELRDVAAKIPRKLGVEIARIGVYAAGNLLSEASSNPIALLGDLADFAAPECAELSKWRAVVELLFTKEGQLRKKVTKTQGFPVKGPGAVEFKEQFAELIAEIGSIPGLAEALGQLRAIPDPSYSDPQWRSIEALFMVLKLAAAELKIAFRQAGVVDFAEISHAALAALGQAQDPSELALLLDYQIQHLLIDEFQDTSTTQFELIERLLDGWNVGDGRSLFLVGDPMQSIYRFRQAEVGLFHGTREAGRLAAVPLQVLQLTTNFRSQAGVIAWINESLTKMRDDPACPFLDLPRLIAARPTTDREPVAIRGFIAADTAAESNAVVEIVQRTQLENPQASIGILVRGRRHLGTISAALRAADIAVSANEIERLGDQSIVQDLVALTRAMLHLADRTAWLACLRAPWCGLSLTALAQLFEGDQRTTIWQQLNDEIKISRLTDQEQVLLKHFRATIRPSLNAVAREGLAPLLERTWLALGGPNPHPVTSLSHADRYFELLQDCARNEILVSATRIDVLLERQFVAPPAQSQSLLKIMTIHRAKGLEFDVVILPGLGRVPRAESHRLLAWREHLGTDGRELLFAPIPRSGDQDDSIHAYLHRSEKKELDDEGYRLLYVALTRARESLHLIGTTKELADGRVSTPAARSFLRMLWGSVDEGASFVRHAPIQARVSTDSEPRDQTIKRPLIAHTDLNLTAALTPAQGAMAVPADVEFEWASPTAKHIGTVTHTLLQLLDFGDGEQLSAARIQSLAPYIEGRLRGFGVATGELSAAREQIMEAALCMVRSQRGRWMMDPRHEQAMSEYALTAVLENRTINIIIDRTFIDADGVRWVIDFKTSTHSGGSTEAFLDNEVERYRPQLERYAQIMHTRAQNPIALGLFFPLLDGWREWRYVAQPHAAKGT
ncbi:MAG: UvrD-helicase domain-containing protein [Proteobacteria bacterium]|nr:UvrD-helicase domain-containing protein [Pseudomonadota bacterium]